ncbi:MAG: autotransporter domain-containing protein [Ahniella sp.]|nr:autotransporter domain-containing protein [Ahniella sp.]
MTLAHRILNRGLAPLARLAILPAVLVFAALLAPGTAQAVSGCQLQFASPDIATTTPNGTVNFTASIAEFSGCTGASGTIGITTNTTGPGNITPLTFSGGLNATIPFSVTAGATPGFMEATVTCTAGCAAVTTLTFQITTNNFTLTPGGQPVLRTQVNVPVTVNARALRNGAPYAGASVDYDVTGPGLFTFNPTLPVISDGSGNAVTQFSADTVGAYLLDGDYCNPDLTQNCSPVGTSFTVLVGTALQAAIGNPLGGNANTSLPPVKVVALDGGLPAANIPITWAIQSGNGSIGATTNTTDGAGEAGAVVNLGNSPGTTVVLRATRTDTSQFVDIPLAINDVYTLTAVSPLTLTAQVNQPLPITARYLLNSAPNPNNVNWNVGPSGPILTPPSVPPNGTGDATTTFLSASTGTYTVTANGACGTPVPGCPPAPVIFTVNVVNPTLNAGADVEANPGENIVLSATALNDGLPAAGVTVNWTLNTGTATPANGSSITNGAGIATFPVLVGTAVPSVVTYTATRADAPSATDAVSITVVAPTVTLISGNNQTGLTSTTTLLPLVVELRDGKTISNPLPGKTISWGTQSGPAFPQAGSSVTDGAGRASVFANYGASGGASVIRASDAGPGLAFTDFSLTSLLPTLVRVSGDGQTGAPGATLAPLVVRPENNTVPAPGVTINWVVSSGSATLSGPSSISNGSGLATIIPTLPINGGTSQITASRADAPGVQTIFTISSNGLLTVLSGDGQQGAPNAPGPQPLVARLNAGASPVAGATVTWSVVSGAGSVNLGGTPSITDPNGDASLGFSFGSTPGVATVRASAFGGTTIADFTVTTAPLDLTVFSGDGQTGLPGSALAQPLVVLADSAGTPNAGVTIDWSVSGAATLSQPSTITDGSGLASVNLTLGNAVGPVQVTARRSDSGATVTFIAIATGRLLPVSGNNQVGALNATADAPLVLALIDDASVGIGGQLIQWRVLSGAAVLASGSSVTAASGQASMTFRYGATAGPIQIEASAFDGLLQTLFTANGTIGNLSIVAGQNQSAPVATVLPVAFRLRVTEGAVVAGNAKARAGIPVTWTVTSGGGTLTQQTNLTDSAGEATATLRLGSARGLNRVVASVAGSGTLEFLATGLLENAALSAVSGNQQTLPTNTDSEPLKVRLADSGGRAVDGVVVQWTGDNVLLSAETCTTDTAGECSIRVRVDLPGPASATARTSSPNAGPLVFTLNGAVAELTNLTPEQGAIADAIDSACPALAALGNTRTPAENDLFQRCREIVDAAGIDPNAASEALEALFPDVALVQSNASLLAAQAQLGNIKARMTNLRGNMPTNALSGLTMTGPGGQLGFGELLGYLLNADDTGTPEAGAAFSRWGFFASGQLGRIEADGSSVNPAYDMDINGLTVGVDYRKSDRLVLGAALGYTRQDADLAGDTGTLDTQGYSVSGYASYYYGTNWYLDNVVTWGRNSYDMERRIRYSLPRAGGGISTVDQTARSSSDGDMLSLSATIGRDFQRDAWSFGPYGRLTWSRFGFDEAVETLQSQSGAGLGMIIDTRDVTSILGVVGGRVSFTHSTNWGILMPNLSLEWEHEFKDDPGVIEARFINDPTGTPIVVSGESYDSDFMRLGLGLSMVFANGKSGFVLYERSLGRSDFSEDNLNLGLRIEF